MSVSNMRVIGGIDHGFVRRLVTAGSRKAVWSALDHLAAVSKQQVPLDTSALKNSCAVDVNSEGTQGTVSYDTPYAVKQHETTWYHHQRGRKCKYLEDPVNDPSVQQQMLSIACGAFEQTLGGAGISPGSIRGTFK